MKIVPKKSEPADDVVPYRYPSVAWVSAPVGPLPSGHLKQKLYSLPKAPLGVMLKTVPQPLAPPETVVPYKSPLVACTKAA